MNILTNLNECRDPSKLKHLLGTISTYLNDTDPSILALQKP